MIQRRTGIPRVAVALAVVGCVVAGVSAAAAAEPRADARVKATAAQRLGQDRRERSTPATR